MSDIHIYLERTHPIKVITLEPTGARGPIGPAGDPGVQGPQGDPGPNSVTSATTSDGTANLDILTLTIDDDGGAINVTGSDASIAVSGINGTISAIGENGSIFVDGANASIRTANGGYFETTSTYRISTGGFTTTLSGTQTAPRSISFPDASGTLALTSQLGITLTGDVTGNGTGSISTTISNGAVTLAKLADIGHEKLIGRHATGAGVPQEVGIDGGLEFNGGNIRRAALTGDVTASAGSNTTTLATVNSNVGSFGSATQAVSLTVNAKGLVTAASASTITPAVGSITGLGTGVATALAVNTGTAGAFVVNGGALGTPSSGTLASCTGLPVSTGISGLGTGVATALAVNTGTAGSVIVNGGALGTPSSGTLTSCTGLPVSTGVSGLGTGVATALGNTANATGGFVTVDGSATLTNKTLTTPTINSINQSVGNPLAVTASYGTSTIACFQIRNAASNGLSAASFVSSGFTQNGFIGYANSSATNYADEVFFCSAAKLLSISTAFGSRHLVINTSGDVSIGSGASANSKSVLDLTSTTKGFLPPRMTTAQRDAITSVPAGLMIYNTSTNKLNFYNGSAWEAVTSS